MITEDSDILFVRLLLFPYYIVEKYAVSDAARICTSTRRANPARILLQHLSDIDVKFNIYVQLGGCLDVRGRARLAKKTDNGAK